MLRRYPLSAIRYPVALAAIALPVEAQAPADLVFRGGRIYTVNDKAPVAGALAVRGERIVYVGGAAGAERYIGRRTRVVELGERIVVPGLADAHCHLDGVGQRELVLNLDASASPADVARRAAARARHARPGEWITGLGWIETRWRPRRFLTRYDLDSVTPRNPVYLSRADGHAGVANTVALRLAAITRETDPPPGGEIVRDQHGEPTGMLVDRAHELMLARIPPPRESELERRLEVAADRIVRLGWTQIQDPGYLDAGGSWDQVQRLRRLYAARRIRLRIYKGVHGPGPAADSLLRRGPSVGEFGGRLTMRALKVVLDGALGSRGALLLQPYADAPGSRGRLVTDTASLAPMLRAALRRGLQVQTHAVGDGANRLLLDLYRDAFAAVPERERAVREPRWRAEHAQVISPADIGRFQQLGVIPSMQPSHAIGDLHFAPARLGRERLAGAYAWRSLLATGVPIAGGSDAPLERGEPMIEFYAAVARRDTAGYRGPEWHPEQAVSRDEALKMFTVWPAYAAFEEDRRGTIEPGKWADLTVLSRDIMLIAAPEILRTEAVMTVIGGEIVYER